MSDYRKDGTFFHFAVPPIHNKTSAILTDNCVIRLHKVALISRALSKSPDDICRCCGLEAISRIIESGLCGGFFSGMWDEPQRMYATLFASVSLWSLQKCAWCLMKSIKNGKDDMTLLCLTSYRKIEQNSERRGLTPSFLSLSRAPLRKSMATSSFSSSHWITKGSNHLPRDRFTPFDAVYSCRI